MSHFTGEKTGFQRSVLKLSTIIKLIIGRPQARVLSDSSTLAFLQFLHNPCTSSPNPSIYSSIYLSLGLRANLKSQEKSRVAEDPTSLRKSPPYISGQEVHCGRVHQARPMAFQEEPKLSNITSLGNANPMQKAMCTPLFTFLVMRVVCANCGEMQQRTE